ncbi:kinase-like domain-containing protein [Chaetomium tenue]|uniref:Kinase-like domain-containing protein n=1 Tax=Chaetomium tenue TaxID=1854479 RepID=A0ACB7P4P8_9PEZI|nr:kinase-like domain-containing protein [Chaetomium globosum]
MGGVTERTDLSSGEEVALKLAFIRDNPDLLRGEKDIYEVLNGGIGIPRVRWFGQESELYALVMDALGPSLEDLFNYCGRKFSLKTTLLIADQAIARIEYIHLKGNVLYTIDFGLAREFEYTDHTKQFEGLALGGTRRYASINNHNGRGQSWADNIESLGYVPVYFARGSLPWQGLKVATEDEKDTRIKEMKESISGDTLCDGFLPAEFATYLNYARGLAFGHRPDYSYLRRLFRRRFQAEGLR